MELLTTAEGVDEDGIGRVGPMAWVTSCETPHEHGLTVASPSSARAHRQPVQPALSKVFSAAPFFYLEAGELPDGEGEKQLRAALSPWLQSTADCLGWCGKATSSGGY